MFGATFKGIKRGDRVNFTVRNGLKLVNGKAVPEYVTRSAIVHPLLMFESHVVVKHGNNGQVVNASNYLNHTRHGRLITA